MHLGRKEDMANAKKDRVALHVSLLRYERDLIDFHARMLGMSRSQYIVQTAAFGKRNFSLDLDAAPEEIKRKYNVYHADNPAAGYMPSSEGNKPRKAEDSRVRSEGIFIRVSPYEKETLKRYARETNLSLTDYLLFCGLYASELRKSEQSRFVGAREELRKLFVELRAQGRNLNQIAAAANRIASVAWRDDVDAGLIDQLATDLREDNERTRAAINDAVARIAEISDDADFRTGVVNGRRKGGDGDGDA